MPLTIGADRFPRYSSWNESVPPKPVSWNVCVSLPPEKSVSETFCTSLIGGRSPVTSAVISWKLRNDQYGSLCGCRLSCWQMPA